MTARYASWVAGVSAYLLMAALNIATVMAPGADPPSSASEAPALVSGLALAVFPAIAIGLFVSALTSERRGRRAAFVAVAVVMAGSGILIWRGTIISPRNPEEDPVRFVLEVVQVFVVSTVLTGLAAGVVAWWAARHATGADPSERVLTLATSSLSGERAEWGDGMRAELASIGPASERARFARSAAFFALRRGTGPCPALLAMGVGPCAAALTYAASRMSFERPDGSRGIVGEPIFLAVPLVVLVAAVVGVTLGKSFRAGLETAVLATLAAWVGSIAVQIPEAMRWFADAGVYLVDGDAIGITAERAVLEPVTHWFFLLFWLQTLVSAILAAALGASVVRTGRRRAARAGQMTGTDAATTKRGARLASVVMSSAWHTP